MLTIQARDSGNPMLYSTAVVSVEVEDANDNPPLFEKNNYTAQVQVRSGWPVGCRPFSFFEWGAFMYWILHHLSFSSWVKVIGLPLSCTDSFDLKDVPQIWKNMREDVFGLDLTLEGSRNKNARFAI